MDWWARPGTSSLAHGQPLADHLHNVGELAACFAAAFGASLWGELAGRWHDYGKFARGFQNHLAEAVVRERKGEPRRGHGPDHSTAGALLALEKFGGTGDFADCVQRLENTAALPLSFAIASHHGGLADLTDLKDRLRQKGIGGDFGAHGLLGESRANPSNEQVKEEFETVATPLAPPAWFKERPREKGDGARRCEFFTRMLFSALVDADRLDAERWGAEAEAQPAGREMSWPRERERAQWPTLKDLKQRLDKYLDQPVFAKAVAKAEGEHGPASHAAAVQRYRADVLKACRNAAAWAPDAYTLTVKTGGGKTLSSLAFALDHAVKHGLRRVVVAIPFTSIIEQTARVYRDALGATPDDAWLLEHHSAVDLEAERPAGNRDPDLDALDGGQGAAAQRRRWATENWSAPVVVTTNVQLFESLYSNRPRRCRKLHNLAQSVIVLDEPQTFPPALLWPICDALNELVQHYGCTVVLSTATQPALIEPPRNLTNQQLPFVSPRTGDRVRELFSRDALKREPPELPDRVRVEWVAEQPGFRTNTDRSSTGAATAHAEDADRSEDTERPWHAKVPLEELADFIHARRDAEHQFLGIVNRRADAAELTRLLDDRFGDEATIHLSALMCAAHRSAVIGRKDAAAPESGTIHAALNAGAPCRVVSTQLVEAGVDLDFPVVYRAFGGIDAMTQAAGRCNREGKRGERGGTLRLFKADSPKFGLLRTAEDHGAAIVARLQSPQGLFADTTIAEYFQRLYRDAASGGDIRTMREKFKFRSVAEAFTMIDDHTEPVIVPYGDAARIVDELRARLAREDPSLRPGAYLRKLQRYAVGIYRRQLDTLQRAGAIEPLLPDGDLHTWWMPNEKCYCNRFGLLASDNPADLVC